MVNFKLTRLLESDRRYKQLCKTTKQKASKKNYNITTLFQSHSHIFISIVCNSTYDFVTKTVCVRKRLCDQRGDPFYNDRWISAVTQEASEQNSFLLYHKFDQLRQREEAICHRTQKRRRPTTRQSICPPWTSVKTASTDRSYL